MKFDPNIAPGVYRLTADVQNPHPDRRKNADREWTAALTWSKGTRFVVQRHPGRTVSRLMLVGDRYPASNAITLTYEPSTVEYKRAVALMEAFEPVPEELNDWLTAEHLRNADLADIVWHLHKLGALSLAEIKRLYAAAQEAEERERAARDAPFEDGTKS